MGKPLTAKKVVELRSCLSASSFTRMEVALDVIVVIEKYRLYIYILYYYTHEIRIYIIIIYYYSATETNFFT